jgi:uncharacterized protein YndB with AHSA1/START domain
MPAIKHYLIVNAAIPKVYKAITGIDDLAKWWTENTFFEPNDETIINFNFTEKDKNKMKILNKTENEYVEWKCIEGDKEWIGTKFSFSLESTDVRTILRFQHFNWTEETDFFAHCNYHWGYYLRSLKLYCEQGKGTPFKN